MDTDIEFLQSALSYVFLNCNVDEMASQAKSRVTPVVFRVVLPVSMEKLAKLNNSLSLLVLHQFEVARRVFQLVCFTAFQTLGMLPSLAVVGQLFVVLRITDVPEHCRVSIRDALQIRRLPARVISLEGKVYSKAVPVQYTQSARYFCPSPSCSGSGPYRYIRLHCPGASEADTIQSSFVCDYCGQNLEEDLKSRVLSERCQVQLISSDVSAMVDREDSSSTVVWHRAVTVILRDELVKGVALGQNYRFVGQPVFEGEENPSQRAHLVCTIEANNVLPIRNINRHVMSPAINDKLSKLKLACAYSPWAFPATVAYSFAGRVCPPGVFHRLKMALLLSLVSIESSSRKSDDEGFTADEQEEVSVINSHRHGLHVLSISTDDMMQDRILRYAARFTLSCVHHTQSTSDLFGAVKKDPVSGCTLVSAGSLSLPDRGLCLLSNVGHYKKDVQTALQHVLEEDAITHAIPETGDRHRGSASQKQPVRLPLQCAVWSYAGEGNTKSSRKQACNVASGKGYFGQASLNKALVDRFDIVTNSRCGSSIAEDNAERKICSMLLEASCSDRVELEHCDHLLNEEDIAQLIKLAGNQKPVFAQGSQDLIRSFYMASRRIRSSTAFGTDISATAINSMTSVAAAHAALCLRSEVTEDDATAAILLFEEAMVACYGFSILSITSQPHFRDDNLDAYLGEEHCARMKMFQKQLRHFCAVQGSSLQWEE